MAITTNVRQALKLHCSCGRVPQVALRVGHTRAQVATVACGLHVVEALTELVGVGETSDVRVTVLR